MDLINISPPKKFHYLILLFKYLKAFNLSSDGLNYQIHYDDDNEFQSVKNSPQGSQKGSPPASDSEYQASSDTIDALTLALATAESAIKQLELEKRKLQSELKQARHEVAAQNQLNEFADQSTSPKTNNHDAINKLTHELDTERKKIEIEAVKLTQTNTLNNQLREKLKAQTAEYARLGKKCRDQENLIEQLQKPSLARDIFTGALYVLGGMAIGGCVAAIIVMSGAFLVLSSPALSIVILAAILVPIVMTGIYALNQARTSCCQPKPIIDPVGTTYELQKMMPRRRSSDDNSLGQNNSNISQSSETSLRSSQVHFQEPLVVISPSRKQ